MRRLNLAGALRISVILPIWDLVLLPTQSSAFKLEQGRQLFAVHPVEGPGIGPVSLGKKETASWGQEQA